MIGETGRSDAGAFLSRLLRLDPAAVVRIRPARLYPGPTADPDARLASFAADPDARLASFAADPDARLASFAEMWAMLPFGVLVVRLVALSDVAEGEDPLDTTVEAAALLAGLGEPGPASGPALRRRDEAWRWPLPSQRGRVIDTIPEIEIARVANAAAQTLRSVAGGGLGGRQLGERVVRDALLDHVPIVATGRDGDRVEVPQRLVQAVVRMGFLRHATAGSARPRTPQASEEGLDSGQQSVEGLTEGDTSVTVRRAGRWIGLDCSYGSGWYLPISPLRLS